MTTTESPPVAPRSIPRGDDFFDTEQLRDLTPAVIVERLRELQPTIAARAADCERQGRPLDEVWDAIRATGYFYLLVPRAYGGLEASFDEMLDATFVICEADSSIGWLCSFAVMNPRSAAGFSPAALDELYGGGRYTVLNSLFAPFGEATRVEGGYRVSGTWQWGTTVQNADWVSVMAWRDGTGDGERALGTFLMPAAEVTVLDTWNSHGLVATGTHHVRVDGAFVPDHRTVPYTMVTPGWIADLRDRYRYPLFRADLSTALPLTIAVPLVGMARGALRVYDSHVRTWIKRGYEHPESLNPLVQMRLAHVTAQVRAAESLLRQIAHDIYAITDLPAAEQKLANDIQKANVSYVAHSARDAVLALSKGLGTSVHDLDHPMQRFVRDAIVGCSHVAVDWDSTMESTGRLLLDAPPKDPPKNPRMA